MAGYTDVFGDYHDESGNLGIFRSDSKLQGYDTLTLMAPPIVPAPAVPFPSIMETGAAMGAKTLLDLSTRDNNPHLMTIALGALLNPLDGTKAIPPGTAAEVVAILDIGVGGALYRVEVDYIAGTQFSLAASRLQLHAVWRQLPRGATGAGGGVFTAATATYQVSAAVASGVIAHGLPPQRTLAHLEMAVGRSDTWLVPRFAKRCRVVANPQNAQIDFEIDTFAAVAAHVPIVASPSVEIPIPASAYTFFITNMMPATAITQYNVVCDLAF